MESLILSMLIWIAAQTGLVVSSPPLIQLVSAEEMQRKVPGHSVVAFYDRTTTTIYLPTNWDHKTVYRKAMLLHELVHHVQNVNKVSFRCEGEREKQAYALTLRWLTEQGVNDPYGALNLDEFTVGLYSSCLEE